MTLGYSAQAFEQGGAKFGSPPKKPAPGLQIFGTELDLVPLE